LLLSKHEGLHADCRNTTLPASIIEAASIKFLVDLTLNKVAEAEFPSRFGKFRIFGFEAIRPTETEEAVALKLGDLSDATDPPLVRIHSQCLTGDVFHSLRCDCRSQLELALDSIFKEERGLLIYEHQEGRGIGLLNKLRAYELQDGGLDTVEANERLGFDADLRDYALPAAILLYFNVRRVRLLSNNPDKVAALEKAGIQVIERAPIIVPPLETTADYLRTKREKLGHLF
jgi:GTP cyclohydrolase II